MRSFFPWLLTIAVFVAVSVLQRKRDSVTARPSNPRLPILAHCESCGRVEQDRHGRCPRCGADVVKTLGNTYVFVPSTAHSLKPAVVAGFGPLAATKEEARRNLRQTLGLPVSCIESREVN